MFEEVFTMDIDDVCRELMDMGVDDDLVRECGARIELLCGLYIYVVVEGSNA